jgi:hypothetical protein
MLEGEVPVPVRLKLRIAAAIACAALVLSDIRFSADARPSPPAARC